VIAVSRAGSHDGKTHVMDQHAATLRAPFRTTPIGHATVRRQQRRELRGSGKAGQTMRSSFTLDAHASAALYLRHRLGD
jgi:hypothetical protein